MLSRKIAPVTAKAVLHIFHPMTKGRLMKLCESGTIKPFQESQGQGTTRLFDFKNLIEIAICEQLHRLGAHSFIYKVAVDGFNKFNKEGKDHLALSADIGRSTTDKTEKFYISVSMWSYAEREAYISGNHVNGLIQGEKTNILLIDLNKISRNISGFFNNEGKLRTEVN